MTFTGPQGDLGVVPPYYRSMVTSSHFRCCSGLKFRSIPNISNNALGGHYVVCLSIGRGLYLSEAVKTQRETKDSMVVKALEILKTEMTMKIG